MNFDIIIAFQKHIFEYDHSRNFDRFIALSSSISRGLLDYSNARFLCDGIPILLENVYLKDIFVSIPCLIDRSHIGVQCSLIHHLVNEVGCQDCLYDSGIINLFPME